MSDETAYNERYKKLNIHQRAAVDAIEGPVMVVAGPGTGKTELLSMRTANILRRTDSLPENILCLTFTDSGSVAMQKRLADIIGKSAYNVSIFTFHAFGSEIISRYREYFYRGAEFRPADELNQRHTLISILDTLDYNNPLTAKMNGEYTAIKDILGAISELKRAGLTDSELRAVLDSNHYAAEIITSLIKEVLSERISAATLPKLEALLAPIEAIHEPQVLDDIEPFSRVFLRSLKKAIAEAHEHPKTTPPLTAWKNAWTCLDGQKERILIASKHTAKLQALCYVYGSYIKKMEQAGLYDYDDMIMQVVHAIETRPELRYDLQEKYHYIMVDEFQDTNMAQMRILHNLTNNPIVEGAPNILVVGDDDQAVYSFQGADIGNILHFKDKYRGVKLIPLTDNYRSASAILAPAREVIVQGETRLETSIEGLSKELSAHAKRPDSHVQLVELPLASDERRWLAADVRQQLDNGVKPSEIAIIARKRASLTALVPYFVNESIAISYDKRDNVLEDEAVEQLIALAHVVTSLQQANLDELNQQLPQLLCHPAWGLEPSLLWRISLEAYSSRRLWLDIMMTIDETAPLAEWLLAVARYVPHLPLERMLDYLIGSEPLPDDGPFVSPLKSYFFSTETWQTRTGDYLSLLRNLTTLRTRLREHQPDLSKPRLPDFLSFIEELKSSHTAIASTRHIGEDGEAVRFMTAHSSKGLEFDTVYIIDSTDSGWVKGGKSSSIIYPDNLSIRAHSGSYDDVLRLFFVAMTRAKRRLTISYSLENDAAKPELRARFIADTTLLPLVTPEPLHTHTSEQQATENTWYAPVVALPQQAKRDYLDDFLASYKISATAINAFIDITTVGPELFLLNNLLHFPSARSVHAEFGDAIHQALQHAHDHLKATGSRLPEEDIIGDFEANLKARSLTASELDKWLTQGSDSLQAFLKEKYATFNQNQRAELQFRYQDVVIDNVRLTGKMDVVEIDDAAKTITVTDYKTGQPLTSWDKGADYQKIKAHKYRQQLLFYKLLVEHSRDWRHYTMNAAILQFIEPDKKTAAICDLTISEFDPEELERFKALMVAVWHHIQALDFPDTSHYPASLEGIKAFEDDLINNRL